MGVKHKRTQESYGRTARNSRKDVHVYHPSGDAHKNAVHAGRCDKCNKITDCFCDKCNHWICENHLEKENELDVCEGCVGRETINPISH